MGTKIADNEYLKLADLAYLAFSSKSDRDESLENIFTNRIEILKDEDANNVVSEDEEKRWKEEKEEYWRIKNSGFVAKKLCYLKKVKQCQSPIKFMQ